MGYPGKTEYIYKCKRCGDEHYTTSVQDGSGRIGKLHDRWAVERCECGGSYLLFYSEWWGEDSGGYKEDPKKYFNSESVEFHDALASSLTHDRESVRMRAKEELAKFFPEGSPKAT